MAPPDRSEDGIARETARAAQKLVILVPVPYGEASRPGVEQENLVDAAHVVAAVLGVLAVLAVLAALAVVLWRSRSRRTPLDEVGQFAAARELTNRWSADRPAAGSPDR